MTHNNGSDEKTKDGLNAVLDFTKIVMVLAGGGIAFLLDKDYHIGDEALLPRILDTGTLLLFALSIFFGLGVLTRGAKQLSGGDYTLKNRYIRPAGIGNVLCFTMGMFLLGANTIVRIWGICHYLWFC